MPETILSTEKIYQPFKKLADPLLACAFSSRQHQNMSLFYGETRESLNNRKNFLSQLGINYQDLVCAKQIHAGFTRYVKAEDKGKGASSYDTAMPQTDAFVTDEKNLPLAIFTADCLSIFLYDSLKPAIGLIHSGWRSTKECIAAKTVKLMRELFSTEPKDLYAAFGPAIRSCCYEVEKNFRDFFSYGLNQKDGRYYLDLVQINKKQLIDLGLKENNILDSQICTSCRHEEFFSYRKEGKTCARLMSVIMLK